MSQDHEYAILGGYNRTKVGRSLTQVAATVSGVLVFLILTIADVAKALGINVNIPPVIMSLVGAGMVYAALHWLFDKYAWRVGRISKLLKLPDLAGTWICDGVSESRPAPNSWTGKITIVQSWERIRIHLKTGDSSSNSVAAAILDESPVGYRLMYHYQNEPEAGVVNMAAHHGFAELTFSPDGQSAFGGYFNGRGRNTYGTMRLTKEKA